MGTCGREEVCGRPTTSCRLTGGQQVCTGRVEPSDYRTCAEEYRSALENTLDGCPLNRTTRQLMEDCVNPGLAEACVSPTDAEPLSSDSEPAPPSQPEACDKLFEVEWADCGANP